MKRCLVAGTAVIAALGCQVATRPEPAQCSSSTVMPDAARRFLTGLPRDVQHARGAAEAKAIVARQVPGGFAGIYLTPDERSIVLFTDTSRQRAALPALDTLLKKIYPRSLHVRDATVRPAAWNYAELYAWNRYLLQWFVSADVATLSIDETINRIVFGARDAAARDRVVARLNERRVPCTLFAVQISGSVVLNASPAR